MRNNLSMSLSCCKLLLFLFLIINGLQLSAQIVVDDCNTGEFNQTGPGSQNVTPVSGAIGGSRDVSIANANAFSYINKLTNNGNIWVYPRYNGFNGTGNFDIGWGNNDVLGGTDLNLNAADYSHIQVIFTSVPFNYAQMSVRFNKPGDPDYSSTSVALNGTKIYTLPLSNFSGLNSSDIDGISIGFSNCVPDTVIQIDKIQFSGFADTDGDGVGNGSDNCPTTANANQLDSDGDGQGNVCDACPNDPDNDADGDGVCGNLDNCPSTANTNQLNTDGDGQGNVCDTDDDNDGVADEFDNCPLISNANQLDTDGDGQGNACDIDDDNDDVADAADNCPLTANTDQLNTDGDGQGNACDTDDDNDGIADAVDNCPLVSNANQLDTDGDGQGNACDTDDDNDGVADASDNCPLIANSDQLDTDGDSQGNACDTDDDNDGVADTADNCPLIANADQSDSDNNGVGDACDEPVGDSDGDGIPDEDDNCVEVANPSQADADCDNVGTACDVCPGGDDAVDNNNDGLPDCKYPPAYNQIISAWKCGNNKVYVCHNGNTICINKNALASHIAHGDYLGPCGNAECDDDCDGVGNSCDLCPGGNDAVDNNYDHLPDCKYPPTYNKIIAAWKCGSNKAYVCHNGNTLCINKSQIESYICQGAYLGSCDNATCSAGRGAGEREQQPEVSELLEVALYPNPAAGEAWLDLSAFEGSAFNIRVMDVRGSLVQAFNIARATDEPIRLDLAGYAPGLYIVHLQPEGEQEKMIKLMVEHQK